MKKSLLALIVLLLMVMLAGCGVDTQVMDEKQNKEVVSDNLNNEVNKEDGQADSPHQFSGFAKDEEFVGGVDAKDYNLMNVRRAPHPNFTRLIFEFAVGSKGSESAVEAPKYEITYTEEENKIIANFEGVQHNSLDGKVEDLKQLAPIIKDVNFILNNSELTVIFILKEKVSYQVFPLSSPARVALVLSPDVVQ